MTRGENEYRTVLFCESPEFVGDGTRRNSVKLGTELVGEDVFFLLGESHRKSEAELFAVTEIRGLIENTEAIAKTGYTE